MVKKRRGVRIHNPKMIVYVKYAQREGPKFRRGRFMRKWLPSWRK